MLHFAGFTLHQGEVLGQVRDMQQSHAPVDAPRHRGGLIASKVTARLVQYQGENVLNPPGVGRGLKGLSLLPAPGVGVLKILQNDLRHALRRKDVIRETGGDGMAGHFVELGSPGILRDDHAPGAANGPCAERPI